MVFPILGANSATGGYEVSNSLRFNDDDSAYLSRTPSSGDRHTFTISMWVKRANLGDTTLISSGLGSDLMNINFASGGELQLYNSNGGDIQTTRKFRDVAAWYHIVIAVDTEQSTASDRVKFYVNGVQETAFNAASYPSQNLDMMFNVNSSFPISIGKYPTSNSTFFDGYMAEVVVIDGTQLNQNSFGEFNDDNVWIPKDVSGLTFGTNGFYLQFKQTGTSANSSGMGADTSGNDNHLTPNNLAALDITEDTCTNNFATCNFLTGKNTQDLRDGNLVLDADSSGDIVAPSTIGFSSGKWYMEMKSTITAGHGNRKTVGVYDTDSDINHPRGFSSSIPYNGVVVDLRNGSAYESADDGDATDISSFSNNDICGLAYDADNGLLYVYKNGSAQNSGNAINAGNALDTSKTYAFYLGQDGGGTNHGELFCNFGNPSFSISSGNNDGKYGNFEYAPPSGYYALCTKRLAEFG